MTRAALLVTSAGSSARMRRGGACVQKKEYLPLTSRQPGVCLLSEILVRALEARSFFLVVVTVPAGEVAYAESQVACDSRLSAFPSRTRPVILYVPGAHTRSASVRAGLDAMATHAPDVVLVHDGARPFVSVALIHSVLEATCRYGAAVPVIEATDTPKGVAADGSIETHLIRSRVRLAQTPQGFCYASLCAAHHRAATDGEQYTDDSELYARYGGTVHVCAGERSNVKITYPEDLEQRASEPALTRGISVLPCTEEGALRVGLGTDMHALCAGRPLILAGIHIPSKKGAQGHSDADVLAHASIDALLGAAGLGDIGTFFPSCDGRWKDAHSCALLRHTWQLVRAACWRLVNLDAVVCLEQPALHPFREAMRASLAQALDTHVTRVFVKAKTAERL